MSYLIAAWTFLKGIDPVYVLVAGIGLVCFFCGCKCEHDRPHWIVKAPEPVVMTIDGKDYTYDRTPEGGWKRRE